MISRLTETEPENWPTVTPETLVTVAVVDESEIQDDEPIGYYGATLYPEDGLLIFAYRKHGQTFATPADEVTCDCAGNLIETNAHEAHCAVYMTQTTEYADTGLGFLTVDRVVELVELAGTWTHEDARDWVLSMIERT